MQGSRGRSEEPRPRSESQSQRPRRRATSRDSSVSSSSREVRCACQFFQSDSLLPERRLNPVGRPSSRTSNVMASPHVGDHEYEPIGAPPPKITDELDLGPDEEFDAIKVVPPKSETSSTSSRERRFLRIPLDDELVVPGDGEDEDEAMAIRSMEGENGEAKQMSPQELQADLEDRYFAATPTTTESRTDYDVNTSQLDSSGLEDVPLKKEARKKKQQELSADQQTRARGFQQRLRSQAGRIRSKLRSMPKPNIKLPDRPKFNFPERPKFNLPERPKFHLPERPKFNLPERPKFNFPDRPKFHLPERPKFNFPERPKFNLPQRPKLSMPSFGMSKDRKDKPRFSSTRRPLRERSMHSSASTASSTKKNIFDFDFKSYPRIFDRKAKRADYATSSPKPSRGQTPPPQLPTRKKGRWLQRFTDLKDAEDVVQPSASEADSRIKDDLEGDEFREDMEMAEAEAASGRSESTSAFRDKDYGYAVTMDDALEQPLEHRHASTSSVPESDREVRSSGSSSLRHRAGVLEEIDSDEFFLREKGLSQEDVEVGRYLTSEIRDAFRAPVSALSQMDNFEYYDDEEDVENLGQQYRSTPDRGPTRPARTRSLRTRKRSSKSKEPSPAEEDFFNTFPPARPKRSRRHQQQVENAQEGEEEEEIPAKDKQEEGYEQEMEVEEVEERKPTSRTDIPSFTVTDEDDKLVRQSTEEYEEDLEAAPEEQWQVEEELVAEIQPPMPPKRMRRSRKQPIPDTLCNGDYTKEDWLENLERQIGPTEEVMVMRMEPDYIIPAAPPEDFELPPEPPRRGRRKSSRGTSLADEDRTSRGAESLPSERDHTVDIDLPCDLSLPEIPGYASVEKPFTKPRRQKTSRPSVPGRRKKSTSQPRSYPHFYSLPHRPPPIRPLRNYSTLGPSRPPRRQKILAPEFTDQKSESYIEIEDDILTPSQLEESHGSARDLQSGDIVERMKGRPLPPPPRPPRKGRESREPLESEDDQAPLYKDEEDDDVPETEEFFESTKEEPLGALSDKIFYARPEVTSYEEQKVEEFETEVKESSPLDLEEDEREESPVLEETKEKEISSLSLEIPVEEVSVATQTDPLPDDVCVITGEEEVPVVTTATIGTETTGLVPSTTEFGQQTIPEPPRSPPPPTIIEKPIPYYVMPDPDTEIELKAQKLQVSELDVERLNVGELQAQKILVSDIDGMSMQVAELTSKSGNLVVSGLELPPGFLQDLYDSLPIPTPPPAPPPIIQYVSVPTPVPQPSQVTESHSQSIAESREILQAPSLHTETSEMSPSTPAPDISPTPQVFESPPSVTSSLAESPSESPTNSHAASVPASHTEVPAQSTVSSEVPADPPSVPEAATVPPPPQQIPAVPQTSQQLSTSPQQEPQASQQISSEGSQQVPVASQQIPVASQQVTVASQQISVASQQVPVALQQLPVTSQQFPTVSQQVPIAPQQVPTAPQQIPTAPQVPPNPQQIPTVPNVPVQQSIPLQSILNPSLVTSLDGLHSYIPEYLPSQVPVSVRVPSRTRSHLSHMQREIESEEEMISLMHSPSSRRRRHHVSKPISRYSSDEEEEEDYSSLRPPSRRHHSTSRMAEASVGDLSRQLLHACQGVTMRALHQLVQYVAPQVRDGEDKRRDLQIALCILLVLVAGLILLGFGSGKTYHHHHWDYHFPPSHS